MVEQALYDLSPGQIAVLLGVLVLLLGYFTPFMGNWFSRDRGGQAARAIKMDRIGAWLIIGGIYLATLGFLNLFHVLLYSP
jgi:hypothetical protein